MARQRRGGFRPPELRGTFGTLLRTTLAQAGNLRDVLERGAREGRERLDGVMASRRRGDALAELGEIVLDLIRRGEIDPEELPEVRDVVAHLDELDADGVEEEPPPRSIRKRGDSGGRDPRDGTVSAAARAPRRPVTPAIPRTPNLSPVPGLAARKGGISFDSDDDLADYMHPDDVPPKGSDGDA